MSKNLKIVQIAKRQLNMDDYIYRDLLERVTGKRSAKGQSEYQLGKVIEEMKRLGFKLKSNKSKAKPRSKMAGKIKAIWITMYQQGFVKNGSDQAIDSYVKRMTAATNGRGVERLIWLDENQAYTVLETLKRWHYRMMSEVITSKGGKIPKNADLTGPCSYDDLCLEYKKYAD